MCICELKGKEVPIKLWTQLDSVESQALDQLKNIASLPWVFKHVAVMPDVHFGKGATVGSVIAMKDALSPAAVGVDIGCGMAAVRTNLKASDLPDSLKDIRSQIEKAIPVGFSEHGKPAFESLQLFKHGQTMVLLRELLKEFDQLTEKVQDRYGKAMNQIGTLGGGNHFIEM